MVRKICLQYYYRIHTSIPRERGGKNCFAVPRIFANSSSYTNCQIAPRSDYLEIFLLTPALVRVKPQTALRLFFFKREKFANINGKIYKSEKRLCNNFQTRCKNNRRAVGTAVAKESFATILARLSFLKFNVINNDEIVLRESPETRQETRMISPNTTITSLEMKTSIVKRRRKEPQKRS